MNINEIRKFYEIIKENNQLTEIRGVDTNSKKTLSGYFTDVETIISEVSKYDNFNLYFTLNRINEACASRSQANKLMQSPKTSTADNDIISRDWVLIDLDPKRPTDTNATDQEKELAKEVANRIFAFLRDVGFARPIIADSSNGYHFLYKVQMKNSTENNELIKRFLATIDTMFSTEDVDVDTTVFNPSRICKLYGTVSRKGSNSTDRPQRQSKFYRLPKEIKITPVELFKRVVAMIPEPEKPSTSNNFTTSFDINDFIRRNGILVDKEIETKSGRKILLKECPFDSSHTSPDSAIFVMANGAIGFKCLHNSCSNYTWHDLRQKFEPKREYQRTNQPIRPTPSLPQKEDKRGSKFLNLCDIEDIDQNKTVAIPSGFTELDKRIIGFNLGEVSLWTGNNASGKSTVLSHIAINSAKAGFPTALYSGELKASRVKQWLQLQCAGRQYTEKSRDWDSYYVPKECGEQIDQWLKDKLFIYNNQYGNKVLPLLDDLKEAVAKGVKCIILDNLMSLDIFELDGDKYSKQTNLILLITEFAKQYDVHIHIVAHPRKATGFLRKTDVSGTADLTNAVDNVFIAHRVNNDFRLNAKEFLTEAYASQFFEFGNVIEVCKHRDLGVQDYLIGLYFEIESKRLLNYRYENINYDWQTKQQDFAFPQGEGYDDGDLPASYLT